MNVLPISQTQFCLAQQSTDILLSYNAYLIKGDLISRIFSLLSQDQGTVNQKVLASTDTPPLLCLSFSLFYFVLISNPLPASVSR